MIPKRFPSGRMLRMLATTGFVVAAMVASAAAQGTPPNKPPAKQAASQQQDSLDKQLLDDLGGDLLEGLDLPPVAPPDSPTKSATPRSTDPKSAAKEDPSSAEPAAGGEPSTADKQLLDQLIDGEDVGLSGGDDPILDIGRRMKAVERMISQRNTSAGTQQMQRQIAADIATLIEKLRQQRQQPSPGDSKSSPKPQPGAPQPEPGDKESNKPADDSQDRAGSNSEPFEVGAMDDLLKDVWGHLPEQVRRQMLTGSGEQVLPKYRKLIEEYYKRLAEDAEKYP
ncbi:MAG: hypothetical protein RIC55_05610 [Pirellulaceae bacterium]